MTVFNSMLNIMPFNCRYCVGGHKGMEHVSEEALLRGVHLIELQKEQAEKEPVWNTLATLNPIFVNGFGHGNGDVYTGDSEEVIFSTDDCSILAGRVVYLLSCKTAQRLGPAAVANGAIAYGGFVISWTWMANDLTADPYQDWYAEGFYQASNAFPIALLRGYTIGQAKDKSIEEYNRWIEIWETERADDKYAAEAIKYLLYDRDGLTVLGDTTATISSAAGVRTSLNVVEPPPAEIHTNESFTVEGTLLEFESGVPLVAQTIELHELSEHKILGTTITEGDGSWLIPASLSKGAKRIYAIYLGDETYGPCASERYDVAVGFTDMKVLAEPKSTVEVNELVRFGGSLVDKTSLAGIGGARIKVLIDNNLETSVVTDSIGYWSFETSFSEISRHTLRAEFAGTEDFVSAVTKDYRISVGVLPSIGNSTLPPDNRKLYVGCHLYIKGERFEVPEDGSLESLVVNGRWLPGEMQGAAYKWISDTQLALIGTTEVLNIKEEETGWLLLVFNGKEKITKGDTICLCVHSSTNSLILYDALVPEGEAGWESGHNLFYYPEWLLSIHWQARKYMIFAEYKREVSEVMHRESRTSFTFRVEVPSEDHETITKFVEGFDGEVIPPGTAKQLLVGVVCTVNGKACDLAGKTVMVLNHNGILIAEGLLQEWDPTKGCYVSELMHVFAPQDEGEYTWEGLFPRQ